jgi:hypothetical protein
MAKGHAPQAAFHGAAPRGPNAGGGAAARGPAGAPLQPRAGGGSLQKLESRFCVRDDPLDGLGGLRLSASVSNEARAAAAKAASGRVRAGDKSDRATVEQALDPRTRMVLFKMLNRGVFSEIHGCVSTGKEANVYHATGGQGPAAADLAVKVYKTSVLVFKDRDRYVTGDYRFRAGYCRSNPRKMVKARGLLGGGRGGAGVAGARARLRAAGARERAAGRSGLAGQGRWGRRGGRRACGVRAARAAAGRTRGDSRGWRLLDSTAGARLTLRMRPPCARRCGRRRRCATCRACAPPACARRRR